VKLLGFEIKRLAKQANDPLAAMARQSTDLSGRAVTLGGPNAITSLGPGIPIGPAHPEEQFPRLWDYTPGYNIGIRPRSYETFDYTTLFSLADNWDVAGLCIEKRIDDFIKHPWEIRPRAIEGQNRKDALVRQAKYEDAIAEATGFFLTPDQINPWSAWIGKYMRDLWKGDCGTVYLHPNRAGKLYAAEIPDGQTFRPVIDLWGRRPLVPPDTERHLHDWQGSLASGMFCAVCGCAPAFAQVIKGMNWTWFGSDEILWQPRWLRQGPYGHPPAEWIILSVNRALRRQSLDLSLFTEGTIPAAFVKFPESWTTQQGLDFLAAVNSMFAGNDVARSRLMPIPGGPNSGVEHINATPDITAEEWLLHIGCAAYGQSPIEMGFVRGPSGGLGGSKTAAGTQSTASQERDVALANHIKWAVLDRILATYWDPQLEFIFTDLVPEEDQVAQATVDDLAWKKGVVSTDWLAENRYKIDGPGLEATIVTGQGQVVLVSDFLKGPPPGTPPFGAPSPAPTSRAAPPAPSAEPGVATSDSPGAPSTKLAKSDLSQVELVKVVQADLSHQYPAKLTNWVSKLVWRFDDGVKVADMHGEAGDGKSRKIIDAIGLAMQADAPIDPLVLVEFPGELAVANGNKRYAAAEEQGVKKLPAYIGTVAAEDVDTVHAAIVEMQSPKYQEPAAKADLARWERKARTALRLGKSAAVPFSSAVIPLPTQERVSAALCGARTIPDVHRAFAGAPDPVATELLRLARTIKVVAPEHAEPLAKAVSDLERSSA